MLNLEEKGVKSASFNIYFARSTSFRIFRSSIDGIQRLLIITRKECQRCEFRVVKLVTRRRMEVPEIRHGDRTLTGMAVQHRRIKRSGQQTATSARVVMPPRAPRHDRAHPPCRRDLNSFDLWFSGHLLFYCFSLLESSLEEILRVFERILLSCIWIEFAAIEDCSTALVTDSLSRSCC